MPIVVKPRFQKYLVAAFAIAMAAPIALSLYQWRQWGKDPSSRPKPGIQTLNIEFDSIVKTYDVKERKSYDRLSTTGVMGFFLTNESPEQVLSTLRLRALSAGWTVSRKRTKPALSILLCKSGTALTIESVPKNEFLSQTHVQVTWTIDAQAPDFCPAQASSGGRGPSGDHG